MDGFGRPLKNTLVLLKMMFAPLLVALGYHLRRAALSEDFDYGTDSGPH